MTKGTVKINKKKNGKYNAKLTFGNKKNLTTVVTGEYDYKKNAKRRALEVASILVQDVVFQ